jgi:hypothetical protein
MASAARPSPTRSNGPPTGPTQRAVGAASPARHPRLLGRKLTCTFVPVGLRPLQRVQSDYKRRRAPSKWTGRARLAKWPSCSSPAPAGPEAHAARSFRSVCARCNLCIVAVAGVERRFRGLAGLLFQRTGRATRRPPRCAGSSRARSFLSVCAGCNLSRVVASGVEHRFRGVSGLRFSGLAGLCFSEVVELLSSPARAKPEAHVHVRCCRSAPVATCAEW